MTQTPEVHTVPPAQTMPHDPQLLLSVCRFAHMPDAAQYTVGDTHTVLQVPPEHAVPGPHTVPHAPQLVLLVLSVVSHPLVRMPSQFPKPAAQLPIPHVPPVHDGVPWAGVGHALPHAPHVVTDEFRFDSHPFAIVPSQFANPALHDPMLHAPPMHEAVALAGGAQV